MFRVWIGKHKFLLLLAVLFLLLRLPSLFEPYWYGDEGVYLTIGQALNHGEVLYQQIHDNKPPTLYYLAALGQTVFGFRLLLMLWMIPTIYIFYLLSKKFLSLKLAQTSTLLFLILTSIPLVEGNIANAEIFMLLPTLLGVYFAFTASKYFHYLIAGFLLGFAFTIKIPVLFEFLFLAFWLVIHQYKKLKLLIVNLFYFSLGFTTPIFLFGLYYLISGAFQQFIVAALLQNFGYLSSWTTGTHSSSATSGGLTIRAAFLIFSFIFLFLLYYKKIISRQLTFILLWFAATLFGVLLSGRPYPHYLIQLLPPLSLLIVLLFSLKPLLSKIPIVICFSILIFSLIKYHFYFYSTYSYYKNYYSYAFKLKPTADYNNYFGSQVNQIYQLAKIIDDQTTSQDRIFVWGDHPYLYALSNRLPTTKYTVAYHIVDFNGYDLTMSQLQAHFPSLIIYYGNQNRPFPNLDNFIIRYYSLIDTVGNALVFQKR